MTFCRLGKRKRPTDSADGGFGSSSTSAAASSSRSVTDDGAAGSSAASGIDKGKKKAKGGGFQAMGLSQPVLAGILRLGYKVPTPIQRKTLPVALSGKDVVAMARTGSGKTAAFLLPMIEKLQSHSTKIGARAVILSPTRELALQTLRFARSLAKFTDLRFASIVGGESMEGQFAELSKNPDVLVATPGRLMHHLQEIPGFHLKSVEYAAFDEADRLFEMGFADQLNDILSRMPEHKQTLLISATLPKILVQFAKAGLKDPELIRLDVDTRVSENLKLGFFTVRKDEKPAALMFVLKHVIPADQQAIVFVATRHHSEYICKILQLGGISAETVYGAMDQTARKANLAKFVARKCQVLVVTDVAARGLDIPLLDNTINYDFPDKSKLFVHRVGRVARQGRPGCAISLVGSTDVPYMLDTLLFLARPVSNVFLGADGATLVNSSGVTSSRHGGGFAVPKRQASDAGDDVGSLDGAGDDRSVTTFATTATALTNVIRLDEGKGYSLNEMRPVDVHYGSIPRSALEVDVEAVRDMLLKDVELRRLKKSADNAYELYNKTRAEASRQSAARAHKLNDDRIHPLLMQYAGKGEADLRSYLEGLKAFRPQQTVMEIQGASRVKGQKAMASSSSGPAGTSRTKIDASAEAMAAKRKFHAHAVQPRVGSVSLAAVAVAAAKGSLALDEGVIGENLKAELAGLSMSVGDTVDEMVARYRARTAKAKQLEDADAAAAAAAAAGDSDDEEGDGDDDEFDGGDDVEQQIDSGGAGDSDDDDSDGHDGVSIADTLASAAAPLGKRRLSKSERRQLAKMGGATSVAAMRMAAAAQRSRAAAEAAALGINITEGGDGSGGGGGELGTGTMTKAERRRLLREGGADASKAFVDSAHYVSFAPAGDRMTEVAFGAGGTAASAEAAIGKPGRGDTEASDMAGLIRFEDSTMDLMADDATGMNKGSKKMVRYWDPIKKRYLKVSADQIGAGGKRKMSAVRNESGAIVPGGTKSKKDKHEHGALYRQWVKKTRKQVEGGGEEGDDFAVGNAYEQRGVVEFGGDDDGAGDGEQERGGGRGGGKGKGGGKGGKGAGSHGKGGPGRSSHGDHREGGSKSGGYSGGKRSRDGDDDGGRGGGGAGGKRKRGADSDGSKGQHVTDQLRGAKQIKQERERKNRSKGIFKGRGDREDRGGGGSGFSSGGGSGGKQYKRGKGPAPSRAKVVGKTGAHGFGIKRGAGGGKDPRKGGKGGKGGKSFGGKGGKR